MQTLRNDYYTVWQSGKTDIMREALIGQNVNARMHTMSFTLSGSSPSLAFISVSYQISIVSISTDTYHNEIPNQIL